MRIAAVAAALALAAGLPACGSHSGHPAEGPPPAVAAAFPAARWVPARPSYVIAARTVADAQQALDDLLGAVGPLLGVDASAVSSSLERILAVDPLRAAAVSAIGIDPAGGFAMFSEDFDPTFVVHLSAPDALAAFFEHQREAGLVTQSVIVDGDEVFTARLGWGAQISWAVDHDWLWVHFALTGPVRDTAWFEHSRHPAGTEWLADWSWAQTAATTPSRAGNAAPSPRVVGLVGLADLAGRLAKRLPPVLACARLVEPVRRVAISIGGDRTHLDGRIALELGPAASALASHLLPPPPGWSVAAATAPVAAQWNLDLPALASWFRPCADATGASLADLESFGVRSARGMLLAFDPDDKTAARAAGSFDLSAKTWAAALLDQIPMRSHLEQDRTFGAYRGHRVAVPFVTTVDYVLTDQVALAGLGEGLLDAIVAAPPGPPHAAGVPPVLSLDLRPPRMSEKAWAWLLHQAGLGETRALAARLLGWRDGRVSLALDGESLVLEASGDRR